MKSPTLFREYIWLINTIRRSDGITLAELNRKWMSTDMSEGRPLSRITFYRHKESIEEMFGVLIECDKSDGYKYRIENRHLLRDDSMQNWMLSTFAVNNVIAEGMSLKDRILLENMQSGGDWLQIVIDAMKQKVCVEISYLRYGAESAKRICIEPYCLKLFKQRWYVLGHLYRTPTESNPKTEYMSLFSFDRIEGMELTNKKFELNPDFSAEEYFADSYGVFVDENMKTQRVVLRAFAQERYYMADLPIHPSQRIVAKGDGYVDFVVRIRPTRDFQSYIISRGALLKVMEPQWLADEVKGMLQKAIDMY